MTIDSDCRNTLKVLGYLFLRMGRTESAHRTFAALAALLPEDACPAERSWVQRNLAATALEQGDGTAALAHLDKATDGLTPTSTDAALHLMRARALWQQGRHDEARYAVDTYLHMAGSRA